jgi:hypothetical protein
MDGVGELASTPGAAAEPAQDAPGLQAGRWRVRPDRAAGHEPGWRPSARRACRLAGQLAQDAPDRGRGRVVDGAGQRSGHPHDVGPAGIVLAALEPFRKVPGRGVAQMPAGPRPGLGQGGGSMLPFGEQQPVELGLPVPRWTGR